MPISACRSSGSSDLLEFLDLGEQPLADALVRQADLASGGEKRYPLALAFCPESALVQITENVPPERLFVDNYLYFSSFSDAVLDHASGHAKDLIGRQDLGSDSFVVEIASNDGYLLRNFVEAGVPVLGIDPAPQQAAAAVAAGVPTRPEFFGRALAEELVATGPKADVLIANNVFAHVPDINDFTLGLRTLLADDGVITIENPYVRDLIDQTAFDTIYHEHFYYHSCTSIDRHLRRHGLALNDVEYFPDLHGGTLRWWIGHHSQPTATVDRYLADERAIGLDRIDYYQAFGERVSELKGRLRTLIGDLRADDRTVAAYGAAAKGATLLNYVGLGTDLVEFVVDRNVHKHGYLMPGTHQPVCDPAVLLDERPDYVLLLAWNFKHEIREQQAEYLARGGRFIVPVPTPEIWP